jgi:hypothetical protein
MRLYQATYEFCEADSGNITELSLYILASDFQIATRLAGTNETICKWFNTAGDLASMLSEVELMAGDVLQE